MEVVIKSGIVRIGEGGILVIGDGIPPHTPPSSAPVFSGEGTDSGVGDININVASTFTTGDLVFALISSNDASTGFTLDTPTAGTSGAWTTLFNGTPNDGTVKVALFSKVATANDSSIVTFTGTDEVSHITTAEIYKVPTASHNVIDPSTDVTVENASGSLTATGTFPAITVPNSNRLFYLAGYIGNNGNAFTPEPPPGLSLINVNGTSNAVGRAYDVTDQNTPGLKPSFDVSFATANATFVFFAVAYP